jgi:hypothetical protein
MASSFRERIVAYLDGPPEESDRFDLFYASLADGTRIVFGQDG